MNYKSKNVDTQVDDTILVIVYSKSDWDARFLQQRTSMVAVLYQTVFIVRVWLARLIKYMPIYSAAVFNFQVYITDL